MTRLTVFDAFPYLMTRVVPVLYHVILLPADLTDDTLLELAQAQVNANRLQTCLVTGRKRTVYFGIDGQGFETPEPPLRGHSDQRPPGAADRFPRTDEFRERHAYLHARSSESRDRGGYMLGDAIKGSRPATEEELRRLAGTNEDGWPRGLRRCCVCHDWYGVCLDRREDFPGYVMTVHCRCANHNRCARRDAPLHERRLNANYYDVKGNCI